MRRWFPYRRCLDSLDGGGAALTVPILALLQDQRSRAALEEHLPHLVQTELVNFPAQLSLYELEKVSPVPLPVLTRLSEELDPAPVP